jgi:glycosyltransferase involved in cell wall biosynthesis
MNIGLDLSVIQTPHRMRGIGATAINFVNSLPAELKQQHKFVIYLYPEGRDEAIKLLGLEGMDYEIRDLEPLKPLHFNLPGRLKILNGLLNNAKRLLNIYTGDPRVDNLTDVDTFLQFDQNSPLPRSRHVKTALILYDIIPYVMESEYLWTYKTGRKQADSRKSAFRKHIHRSLYKFKTKAVTKRADILIAISQHTKNDFIKYFGLKDSQIQVVHLGIKPSGQKEILYPGFNHYIENSWGYFPKPIDLTDKPFLLFVGGADPRRRLNDLVAAFNNLRAQGIDIRLVFAGDTMKGPHAIPILDTQKYIASSSYLDGMVFLGFISEDQKGWLYQNSLTFVYPSIYEGFGLPVLEAMGYGTPVITYSNTSLQEISQDAALYASNYLDIYDQVKTLLTDHSLRKKLRATGLAQSQKFLWEKTSSKIIGLLAERQL